VTPKALKTLIESDQQATDLINAGNDYACASRCSEIAPVKNIPSPLTITGILFLYRDVLHSKFHELAMQVAQVKRGQ
jgi:hypothetical protein